jgi:hypothetical protein
MSSLLGNHTRWDSSIRAACVATGRPARQRLPVRRRRAAACAAAEPACVEGDAAGRCGATSGGRPAPRQGASGSAQHQCGRAIAEARRVAAARKAGRRRRVPPGRSADGAAAGAGEGCVRRRPARAGAPAATHARSRRRRHSAPSVPLRGGGRAPPPRAVALGEQLSPAPSARHSPAAAVGERGASSRAPARVAGGAGGQRHAGRGGASGGTGDWFRLGLPWNCHRGLAARCLCWPAMQRRRRRCSKPAEAKHSRWDTTLTRTNLTFPPIVSLLKQKNEYFIFFNVH